MASSIDEGDVAQSLLITTSEEVIAHPQLALGLVVVVDPVVDDTNRLERRRYRKKQRIQRKRRERASRWMQTRRR